MLLTKSLFKTFAYYIVAIVIVYPQTVSLPVFAQGTGQGQPIQGSAQVSMTLYQLQTKADGKQYVIARDGSSVPLPPPGMAPGTAQVAIYGDKNGNFWYQSPNGMAVPVNDARLTWNDSQSYAKEEKKKSKWQQRRERRRGALGTFLGAAAGAAAGTVMTSAAYGSYNGVPYGYPIYGNPGSMYYVGPAGTPVYINPNPEALNQIYNQWTTQQKLVHQNRLQYQNQAQQSALQFQQQAHQNALNYQQQRHSNYQTAHNQAINNRQQNHQNWQNSRQQAQKSWAEKKNANRKSWKERRTKTDASRINGEQRKSRFGRRKSSEASGGGRFGGRFSKNKEVRRTGFGDRKGIGEGRFSRSSSGVRNGAKNSRFKRRTR